MSVVIRPLVPDDAEAYVTIRQAMLHDAPHAFLSSPSDDVASAVVRVRQSLSEAPDNVILGAFSPGLIGAIGIFRERHAKASHKAHIWGMYVDPHHRRRGIGRDLVGAAIAHARELGGIRQVHLSVSDAASEARALYETASFRVWGTEPGALSVDGRLLDEHHMVLALNTGSGA